VLGWGARAWAGPGSTSDQRTGKLGGRGGAGVRGQRGKPTPGSSNMGSGARRGHLFYFSFFFVII
jgi:hypothetical protein